MAASFVSRYHLLGQLASGGMGRIMLARRIGPAGFEKLVVLKRPLAEHGATLSAALLAEARLLARINHPNVCQVHDLEEGEDGFFLVLEHLEGLSLWSLLVEAERARIQIDGRAVCGMFEQACEGLEAIHALASRDGTPAGIVHRDISPGNLFLTEAGMIKILDLGIAKGDESEARTPADSIKGKLPWLSPEQVAGRPVDRRSDVFSLGLVVYDVALGRRPASHRVGALACGELELERVPEAIARVIRTAVAIDPARRFPSASAMGAALREAGRSLGGSRGAAELARWAEQCFGAALEARRELVRGAIGDPTEVDAATRELELRSLGLHDAAHGETGDRGAPEAPATAALPKGPPLVRERTAAWVEEVRARVAAGPNAAGEVGPAPVRPAPVGPAPVQRRGRARLAVALAVAAVLAGIAALAPWRCGAATPDATVAVAPPASPPPADAGAIALRASPPPAGAVAPDARAPDAPPPPDREPARSRPAPVRARPAASAWLAIESEPFAEIELDGRSLGPTPLWKVAVTPGRHTLRAEIGNGRTQQRTVEAAAGATVPVRFTWKP